MSLIKAVKRSDFKQVKKLTCLEAINERDSEGRTPLMWACIRDNLEITKYLVAGFGADIDLEDDAGDTALVYAAKSKNIFHNIIHSKANYKHDSDISILEYLIKSIRDPCGDDEMIHPDIDMSFKDAFGTIRSGPGYSDKRITRQDHPKLDRFLKSKIVTDKDAWKPGIVLCKHNGEFCVLGKLSVVKRADGTRPYNRYYEWSTSESETVSLNSIYDYTSEHTQHV